MNALPVVWRGEDPWNFYPNEPEPLGFIRGIAYVLETLAEFDQRGPGAPPQLRSVAAEFIRDSGVSLALFEAAGCDADALTALRAVFATEAPHESR